MSTANPLSRNGDARAGSPAPQQGAAAMQDRPTQTPASDRGGPAAVWDGAWTANEFLQAVEATLIFMLLFFAMFLVGLIF